MSWIQHLSLPVLCLWLITLLIPAVSARGQGVAKSDATYPPAMQGVVVVKLKSAEASKGGSVMDRVMQDIGAQGMRPLFPGISTSPGKHSEALFELERIYEIRYQADLEPHTVASLLAQDSQVEFAEPRYKYALSNNKPMVVVEDNPSSTYHQVPSSSLIAPNDPQFVDMSHLRYLQMPDAWDIVKAADGDVIIGIVDGGVQWTHIDLLDNVWRNPEEIPNGFDDDGNSLIDDISGWNFANGTNDPSGLDRTPSNGEHGTMVAGVAVAVTDNNTGISGTSWNARFIPVNAGCPFTDNAVCFGYEGIVYAAREGADIINVSWGGPDSFLGREVMRIAREEDALIVVSAGNSEGLQGEGSNNDEFPSYPAGYDRVLVVGSTGKNSDIKATFSNYGVSVDVFAPGVNLNSTMPRDNYTTEASGTSFSAPVVSGLAALVKTKNNEWGFDQVREQIRTTSINIDAANDAAFTGLLGRGRVDAVRALEETDIPALRVREVTFVESDQDGAIQEGETVEVTLTLINYLAEASGVTYNVTTSDSLVTMIEQSGTLGTVISGKETVTTFSFRMANTVPNDYSIRFNIDFEGEAYSDRDLIELMVNTVTHDTGVIQVSLTDEGNIGWSGFSDASEGQGFRYFGVNWLFEGGLMVGLGPGNVLSSVRNEEVMTQDEDFERASGSKFGVFKGEATAENGLVILNERGIDEDGGIRIHQESYADTGNENNNFIILRYVVSQTDPAAPPRNNVYVGLYTDWDLTRGGDYARYDEQQRMGIVQSSEENPILLFGTKLLTQNAGISYRSIANEEIFDSRSNGDGFTEEEKWTFLSSGIQTRSVDNDDVSTLIAAGPYRLEAGQFIEVAFAMLAATSIDNMDRFADNAQILWDQSLSSIMPNPVSVEQSGDIEAVRLDAPYPNPVTSDPTIRFVLPRSGSVELSIYDVLGRKVRTLLHTPTPAGVHTVQWDRMNERGERVSSGTYFYRMVVSTSDSKYTASQSLILVR